MNWLPIDELKEGQIVLLWHPKYVQTEVNAYVGQKAGDGYFVGSQRLKTDPVEFALIIGPDGALVT